MSNLYNFKTLAPFTTRGDNFPKSVIRVRRTSLVISSDIAEQFTKTRQVRKGFENTDNPPETIRLIFQVDKKAGIITLTESDRGYALQVRESGNAYLNTTRIKLGMPVADFELMQQKDIPAKSSTYYWFKKA